MERAGKRLLKRAGIIAALLLAALVILVASLDSDALEGPLERWASARAGRQITIEDLELRLLSRAPSAVVDGLRVAQPRWAGEGDLLRIERLVVAVELLPLLRGALILPLLQVEAPRAALLREASGRANWQRSASEAPGARREEFDLPVVRRLIVRDGRLRIDDAARDLRFEGEIEAGQGGAAAEPFRLAGSGRLNDRPFRLSLRSKRLPEGAATQPYPFVAEVRAGGTWLAARGIAAQPFDRGALSARLELRGEDLAELHDFTGLALPNTPPYALETEIRRDGRRLRLRALEGKVGDSDLAGDVTLTLGGVRPKLVAALRSNHLDLDDLGAAFGGAPATGPGETSSAAQRRISRALAASRRLLPDAPLEARRLRAMDAELRFRASAVQARRFPLRAVSFALGLEDGVLTVDPLSFETPRGRIQGTARLDARREVAASALDLRISGVRLGDFFTRRAGRPPIEGALQARVKLTGRGGSVRDAASGADGSVTVIVPSGEVRAAFAELTGINVLRGLGLLLSGDAAQTPLRCGVAHFQVHDGIMTAERIVVDTGDVLITGAGNVDLETEQTDFTLLGHPKDFRLMRVRSPVTVRGPLRRPDLGVQGREAVAQTGLAAALGALVAPIASLLAFVDPGLAEDANCTGLLREARRQGDRPAHSG